MRGIVLVVSVTAACGQVSTTKTDASTTSDSAVVDSLTDGASPDSPPSNNGPMPQLHWTLDGNVNNSGALTGYTLTTPAGVGYGAGKVGQGAMLAAGQYTYVDGMNTALTTYAKVTIGFWFSEPGNASSQAFFDCNNRSTAPYGGVQMGLTNTSVSVCVSTTTSSYLSGGCNGFTAPSANTWHHWLLRYDGSGTGAGQGAPVEIYIDNVLVHTRANDANNNPVWNPGAPNRLYLGIPNSMLDDVRIYNQVFSVADQCRFVVRGTWTGSSCTLP